MMNLVSWTENHYHYILIICYFNIYYQYIKIPLSKTKLFWPQVILDLHIFRISAPT